MAGWLQLTRTTRSTQRTIKRITGDQFFATAWVTKNVVGGVSIGPAAYFGKQVTGDHNSGSNYNGMTFDGPENLGLGTVANYRFANKATASLFYTHDVIENNVGGGNRFWLSLSVPFGG
jgi:hypothetical protein